MTGPAPRPGILDIAPYVGGEAKVAGVERAAKLSSNESPLGPSPAAVAAYKEAAATLHLYPDGGATAVREALARRHGLDPARIVCGAGSDELIALLCRAYAGPGDEVLYSQYGFVMYPIAARGAGATAVVAPERDLVADVDALLARVTPRTRLLFLANPNNPTGTFLAADEVARLREGLRDGVLLVLDAAYAEYVARNDYTSGLDLVDRHDNVVVTRTFSKIYGLAALRIGWAYCPPAVADVLNRLRGPFNVSTPAQVAAQAALEDEAFTAQARAHNDRWLPWLTEELRRLGLVVPPSIANFVLVRFPGGAAQAEAAYDHLTRRGLIPRRMGPYHLPDCLRITVGREEENRAVVAALAELPGR